MSIAVIVLAALGCAAQAGGSSEPRIAFQRFFKGESGIFTMRPDGTGAQRVSHATGRSQNPEFSPDGSSIAYDRSFSIYVADSDGTNRRLVVRNGYDPTWSPDGTRLLFTRYRVDSDVSIHSIDLDGNGRRELTNGSINYTPAWSPDGSKIAFVKDPDLPQIWVMNADGSGATRLTHAKGREDISPAWSPDGTKVLFTRYKSYGRRCLFGGEVYVINIAGGNATNLTNTCRRRDYGGRWSPDGSKIAFTRQTKGDAQIFTMAADGTDVRRLTGGPRGNDLPEWSPDGSKIAFISRRDGNRELYVMNADGEDEARLTRSRGAEYQPTWQGAP